MATWRSTTYKEHLGENGNASPELSIAVDAGRATRTLQIIPGDHLSVWQAARDFIGYAEVVNDDGVRWIRRVTPHPFPPAPWLYCVSMPRTEGISFSGRTLDVAEYKISKHTLIYESLTYDVREDDQVLGSDGRPHEGYLLANGTDELPGHLATRYITKVSKPSAKLLILNRGIMQGVKADVGGQEKPLLEGLPFVEPAAEVQYTWHGVPEDGVPRLLHLTALGCVNDTTFDQYPAETLRLDSIDLGRGRRDPFGNRVYDITYKMNWLPRIGKTAADPTLTARGHNWIYAVHNSEFIVIRVTANGQAGGDKPFRPMDFADLFRPDQP